MRILKTCAHLGVRVPPASIVARGVSRSYGGTRVLDDVSFTCAAGDIVGVIGPNGAGKTTLIRILTTILPPTRGSFEVDGIPDAQPREIRRRIGTLPESNGDYPNLTGRETLRYHAELHGVERAEADARARKLLGDVGLAARADSLVKTYSRGMRQRLGIARALVNDPRVVFLDEPTLGLDPLGQLDLLATIRQIASERRVTILLCTHQLEDVEELCTSALILRGGKLVARGTPDEIRRSVPATRGAKLLVPSAQVPAALARLAQIPGVSAKPDAKPGVLRVELGSAEASAAIAALEGAGIPVLRFEREGARLSDAFFELTKEASA